MKSEVFCKKSAEKFGGIKKKQYLCTVLDKIRLATGELSLVSDFFIHRLYVKKGSTEYPVRWL